MADQGDFTLDDFRKQLDQLQKMGAMKDMLGSIPGMTETIPEGEDPDEQLQRFRRMIDAMSEQERSDPDSIDLDRRQQIAAASGTSAEEVEGFLEQFRQMRELMRRLARMSIWERIKMVTGLSFRGGRLPGPEEE